jgi:GNS1/SUR4 family
VTIELQVCNARFISHFLLWRFPFSYELLRGRPLRSGHFSLSCHGLRRIRAPLYFFKIQPALILWNHPPTTNAWSASSPILYRDLLLNFVRMAMSGIDTSPSVRFTLTPTSLLRFPPEPLPSTLPPPTGESAFAHPFAIPPNIYNAVLSVHIPITVALVYATTATILNRYNEKRGYQPWAISKTRAFRAFVIAHNVLLGLYSAWTFVAMVHAVRVSLDGATEEHGMVGAVDAFCKINGPRGLGDAATFNASTSTWGFTNRALKLAANSMPDTTDIGRIWNEGLAFYGWLFYLSKFYEVFDTLIILAKGKKSSFLQTYHHAGAMMCMWAGIRYMAPPIWMFVLVNSFVHTLMVSQPSQHQYLHHMLI